MVMKQTDVTAQGEIGTTAYVSIEPRKLRYTGDAIAAFKAVKGSENKAHSCAHCDIDDSCFCNGWNNMEGKRVWVVKERANKPPVDVVAKQHTGGQYALTSVLSPRIRLVMQNYRPKESVPEAVMTYSAKFHAAVNEERRQSSGSTRHRSNRRHISNRTGNRCRDSYSCRQH